MAELRRGYSKGSGLEFETGSEGWWYREQELKIEFASRFRSRSARAPHKNIYELFAMVPLGERVPLASEVGFDNFSHQRRIDDQSGHENEMEKCDKTTTMNL